MSNFIAHRALNDKKYKENTKIAILNSLKQDYIKGIEIDVRMTKDKKFVIIHDMSINRTSNGSGLVKNMTLKMLKKYNFGTMENPCKISTLEEILKVVPKNKIILIELKHSKNNDLNSFVSNFYKTVHKYLNKNIYIASFNEELIKTIKQTYPNLNCGVFISSIINKEHINDNYDFIICSSYSIDNIKSCDKPNFIWALKSKKKYNDIKKKFCDNTFYIVDYPYKFL